MPFSVLKIPSRRDFPDWAPVSAVCIKLKVAYPKAFLHQHVEYKRCYKK